MADPAIAAKEIVLELLARFEAREGMKSKDLWPLIEDKPDPARLPDEWAKVARLTSIFTEARPEMVSKRLVWERLLFGVVGTILDWPSFREALLAEIDQRIQELLMYEAHRDIDVPIVNLDVEGEPWQFGPVSFVPVTPEDRQQSWWPMVTGGLGESSAVHQLVCFARVDSPGDLELSTIYAGQVVDEVLLLLRGLCFPIGSRPTLQIGVVNDFPNYSSRPYHLYDPKVSARIESASPQVTRLGPPISPYRLRQDLLSRTDLSFVDGVREIVMREGLQPTEEMLAKLVDGIRWIGEATKPDAASAKFAKLSFALETLIGGEPREDYLTSRGLTAGLAERAAFLVGETAEERAMVHKAVVKHYKPRSDIVHGRGYDVDPERLDEFDSLVRAIAQGLYRHLDRFSSVQELQEWVQGQRYA